MLNGNVENVQNVNLERINVNNGSDAYTSFCTIPQVPADDELLYCCQGTSQQAQNYSANHDGGLLTANNKPLMNIRTSGNFCNNSSPQSSWQLVSQRGQHIKTITTNLNTPVTHQGIGLPLFRVDFTQFKIDNGMGGHTRIVFITDQGTGASRGVFYWQDTTFHQC